ALLWAAGGGSSSQWSFVPPLAGAPGLRFLALRPPILAFRQTVGAARDGMNQPTFSQPRSHFVPDFGYAFRGYTSAREERLSMKILSAAKSIGQTMLAGLLGMGIVVFASSV